MSTRSEANTADRAAVAFRAYLDGDRARMADLVTLLTPCMWHAARAVGLDKHSAEDAVQAAWTTLVSKAETIREPQAVMAWLIVTTRREAVRVSKHASRTSPNETVTTTPEMIVLDEADVSERPDLEVLRRHEHIVLVRHIKSLTPRCREFIRIIAAADKPDYADLATKLGIAVGSVGPTRGRCLAALRKALLADPEWEELNE